ncbi:MAG TPA: ABC transporter ATP-binding protein [Allosphingosinicella sp.]|jgi:ATP-binding cassette subfamily C protein|uniref:ATP-binding cassette domain-containing protein n=1 Tax=Allosphingosinicella sp. TaxID=2823234 RepID=UPI002F28B256
MVAHQPIPAPEPTRATTLRDFASDFLRFIGPRRWKVAILLALGALVEGLGVLLLLPILSVLLGTGAGNQWIDEFTRKLLNLVPGATPTGQLLVLLALFAALLAFRAAVILRRDVLLARIQIGFVDDHRLRIIRAVANTRWDVIARLHHARITHVLGSDVQACGDAAHFGLQSCVALALIAGQAVLVALLSPLLALIVLGLLVAGTLALRPVLGRSRQLGEELTESHLALVTSTTQFLGGLKLAFSQNLQRGFVAEFEEVIGQAGGRRLAFTRQRTAAQLMLTGVAAFVAGLAMLIGIGLLEVAPAALIAFLFVLARMNGPVSQVQTAAQQIFHSLPAYRKLKELESELSRYQRDGAEVGSTPALKLEGRVEFRGVTFLHRDEQGGAGGLRDLDLTIEPGSFVGIMGASGAGKTTFADLLVGLYPPQAGAVLVDGDPLAEERLRAWRDSVSYVSQDPFLFHDTIRRNLLWAKPEAGEEELWDVLERAGADNLVRRMPEGLEAVVGERGSLVSGGERQRLALARALLRRPRLLLLDEATNAVDVEGERAVLSRLHAAPDRPTILMIAHRDTSLHLCERIIELREGRLVRDEAR